MAQNNSNNDDFDDPSFRTQKLPGNSVKVEQMLDQPKRTGTEDKRLKAMEDAVQKAKSKQKHAGVSIEDAYSADELETKKTTDHQKVTHTLKLKRGKEPAANEPDSTLKLKRANVEAADDQDSTPAPLLGWQHWVLLLVSLLLTVAVVYLVMAP